MRRLDAVRFYLLARLLGSLADGATFTVAAVYYVKTAHMSPFELVLVGTVMEAAIFVFEIPTGVVADVYSRRLSVLVGWAVMGVAVVLAGAVPAVPAILAAWALWGLGYTFTSGAWEAWLVDEIGVGAVGPAFVRGSRMGYAGALVGIPLGVVLAATVSLGFAVVAGGVAQLSIAVVGAVAMPETGFRPAPRADRSRRAHLLATAGAGLRLVRVRPLLLLILAIFFFLGASTEAFDRLWEAHFLRDVGLPRIGSLDPVYWFGIFNLGGLGLGLLATTLLAPRMRAAGHAVLTRLLVVLTALQLVALGVFALAGGLAVAIAARYVYTLTRGLAGPVGMTWLNQNIPDSSVRATVISITGQSDAVGQVVGGPGIGGLGSLAGIRAALLAGAALLAPALGLYARALRHDGHEPELADLAEAAESAA